MFAYLVIRQVKICEFAGKNYEGSIWTKSRVFQILFVSSLLQSSCNVSCICCFLSGKVSILLSIYSKLVRQ